MPTPAPTLSPTPGPTVQPTGSPTTPSPTHPGELICGDHVQGQYNGVPLNVEVRMPYDGDMTFDATGSDFEIASITAHDSAGDELSDTDASPSILTVHNLMHSGDYFFVISGAHAGTGVFDFVIQCSSDAPTKSP